MSIEFSKSTHSYALHDGRTLRIETTYLNHIDDSVVSEVPRITNQREWMVSVSGITQEETEQFMAWRARMFEPGNFAPAFLRGPSTIERASA